MKWIKVEDQLPEPMYPHMSNYSRPVLVTVTDGGDPYHGESRSVVEAFYRFDVRRWFVCGSGLLVQHVLAWMPKPAPMSDDDEPEVKSN